MFHESQSGANVERRRLLTAASMTLLVASCGGSNFEPTMAAIEDQENSPESHRTTIDLEIVGLDTELLEVRATSNNPQVAHVTVSGDMSSIIITPGIEGDARIRVEAKAGATTLVREFKFTVGPVEKRTAIVSAVPAESAVRLHNTADHAVDFTLVHNGFPIFESMQQLVAFIRALPNAIVGEGFPRKLWRFIGDVTHHYYPTMPLQFRVAPWGTINSTGFGFCADRAATLVEIARGAGYEARIWSVGGHVVPEVKVERRWEMYDPDLYVYYHDASGRVAGVQDLQANSDLIINPIDPVLPAGSWPYSQTVADIYASESDNRVGDEILLAREQLAGIRLSIPERATLTYPGLWTETPITYEGIGSLTLERQLPDWRYWIGVYASPEPIPLRFAKQARLDLESGWTGNLRLPLFLWDIQGSGIVEIAGQTFAIGSSDLVERLRYRLPVRELTIVEGQSIGLVMQLNMKMFHMTDVVDLSITGKDVWAVKATSQWLGPDFGAGAQFIA